MMMTSTPPSEAAKRLDAIENPPRPSPAYGLSPEQESDLRKHIREMRELNESARGKPGWDEAGYGGGSDWDEWDY